MQRTRHPNEPRQRSQTLSAVVEIKFTSAKRYIVRSIELFDEGNFYHIYNRGIDGENIFRFPNDYRDFIDSFREYTEDVLDVFAYSLLRNHFHSLVYVKKDVVVKRRDGDGLIKLLASRQLGHFFNSYAQSYNRAYNRTGGLFEKPFKRKMVDLCHYTSVILYIHNNPQRHGFVPNFQEWPYSSYHNLIDDFPTFLKRETVLNWFGGIEKFLEAHDKYSTVDKEEKWMIE